MNGPGGDAMAIVWHEGRLYGLNGSGRSPAELDGDAEAERFGPRSVTVPGAVRAWADLAERFGRLGLPDCLGDAIAIAERGVVAGARAASRWREAEREGRAPWPAPRAGRHYRLPGLAETLRAIASEGPDAFYRGHIAREVADACWLDEADLAAHRSEWVEPLRLDVGGIEVCQLPPNCHGAIALEALALSRGTGGLGELERLHHHIEATKLALADGLRLIADGPIPGELLDTKRLARLRGQILPRRAAPGVVPVNGDTTYLCCVDEDRNAVSLIQSLFLKFGSGVLAGETGVVLHNRAACFSEHEGHPNSLAPAKRPYHTIMPGFLLEDGTALGPYGVMGGMMQPQGHLQVVAHLLAGADPQSALDAARFRVGDLGGIGGDVALEPGLWPCADGLRRLGHTVTLAQNPGDFGVGQAILIHDEGLIGGSDGRGEGAIAAS